MDNCFCFQISWLVVVFLKIKKKSYQLWVWGVLLWDCWNYILWASKVNWIYNRLAEVTSTLHCQLVNKFLTFTLPLIIWKSIWWNNFLKFFKIFACRYECLELNNYLFFSSPLLQYLEAHLKFLAFFLQEATLYLGWNRAKEIWECLVTGQDVCELDREVRRGYCG